jgi:hypothetical protein
LVILTPAVVEFVLTGGLLGHNWLKRLFEKFFMIMENKTTDGCPLRTGALVF